MANKQPQFDLATGFVRSGPAGRACGYGRLRGSGRRCRITRCRASAILHAQYPMIGLLVEKLASQAPDMLQKDHTHFILTPGSDWGEEAPWLSRLASVLAGDAPSLTLLINGGAIA